MAGVRDKMRRKMMSRLLGALVLATIFGLVVYSLRMSLRNSNRVRWGDTWAEPTLISLTCVHPPGAKRREAMMEHLQVLQTVLPDNPSTYRAMDRLAAAYEAEHDSEQARAWRDRATESCKRYGGKDCRTDAWWRRIPRKDLCEVPEVGPIPRP
jgi:hypothetical protein